MSARVDERKMSHNPELSAPSAVGDLQGRSVEASDPSFFTRITNAFWSLFSSSTEVQPERIAVPPATVEAAEPQNIQSLKLNLVSGDTIYLEKGDSFDGSVPKAMAYLQDFCNENTIEIESLAGGYGYLTVNGETHKFTPYGINVKMMLEYCGNKKPTDFPI